MPQLFSDYREQLARRVSEQSHGTPRQFIDAIVSQVHYASEGPELYQIKVCHDGVTAIRYDLSAALTAALGVVGGVVGANPVSAAAAVLTCLIALRGLRRGVTEDEARVLLGLRLNGGRSTLSDLGEVVRQLAPSMSDFEIRERLHDLAQLDAVSVTGDIATLQESVILRYAPLQS